MGRADEPGQDREDEGEECRAVEDIGAKAGLGRFRSMRSVHYLAVGDAGDAFIQLTLRDCEAMAAAYLNHFRAKGFEVARPRRRLTVVALNDDRSFAAYLGKNPNSEIAPRSREPIVVTGGLYQRDTNRLVVFDYRNLRATPTRGGGHANRSNLTHELTHQLTFNTGMLNRYGDVPFCILEGLGTYGEERRFTDRPELGQVNTKRLDDLARFQRRAGNAWIPATELLSDDRPFSSGTERFRRILAYAQSWLLVYCLMHDPARLRGFRAYLEAIRGRRDATRRLDDARTHWGDLDQLDKDLRRAAIGLLKAR